jgi:hypothetical protein
MNIYCGYKRVCFLLFMEGMSFICQLNEIVLS